MSRYIGVCLILSGFAWGAAGCSSSTGPDASAVAAYHYTVLGGKRYFEETRIKDTLGVGYYDPISQSLVPYQFQLGDSFSVLRFTDGERIGSGTSRVLGAVVPEPASGTLLATGAAALGLVLWRRRRRHAA